MCGILAEYSISQKKVSDSKFKKALKSMRHRGPDSIQSNFLDKVALGHARLAILDLSSEANQPYSFDNLIMVYNGEVFNFIELREELIHAGYTFDTASDTEVVIKAIHAWDTDAFRKFNGMWAIVIYDIREKSLLVSRDRFGQKPLFYYSEHDRYILCSEIYPFTELTRVEMNKNAVLSFLCDSTLNNQSQTFLKGIYEFPPSETWKINGEKIEKLRYWDYPLPQSTTKPYSEIKSEFEKILENATKIRLLSDVPTGLLLSGGLDSTVIAEIIHRIEPKANMKAFAFSTGADGDESKYANYVAKETGLNFHVSRSILDLNAFNKRLKICVRHLGRAHSSTAIVPVDQLLELAKEEGVTVLLDGQGADELLGGYNDFQLALIPSYLLSGRINEARLALIEMSKYGLLNRLVFNLRNVFPKSIEYRIKKLRGPLKFFDYSHVTMPSNKKGGGYESFLYKHLVKQHSGRLKNLLYYGDIVSMKNSIENRSPFLDHRLVEFCFLNNDELKYKSGVDKRVLRESKYAKRHKQIVDRKKSGFPSPVPRGFREFALDEMSRCPEFIIPLLKNSSEFKKVIMSLRKYASTDFLYKLYQVKLWYDVFLKDKSGMTNP